MPMNLSSYILKSVKGKIQKKGKVWNFHEGDEGMEIVFEQPGYYDSFEY